VNRYESHPAVRVTPLAVDEATLRRLEQGLVLLWLGQRKEDSGRIIRRQSRRVSLGGEALQAMLASKSHVIEMAEAIQRADLAAIGRLLDELWRQKKRFCGRISNGRIDGFYSHLRQTGMIGGKVTGAGGGGHLLACCDTDHRERLLAASREMGLKAVSFHLGSPGLTVQCVQMGQYISDSNIAAG
jgi:D-glycero-alpha-D-manno-heptose-7-phosphate kinase